MYVRFLRRTMSVSVSNNVPRYLHFFQSFFCVLLIACCIVFSLIYSQASFFYNWSNIIHRLVYDASVFADESNVICILLVNYIVSYDVFVLFYAVIVVMKMLNGC